MWVILGQRPGPWRQDVCSQAQVSSGEGRYAMVSGVAIYFIVKYWKHCIFL